MSFLLNGDLGFSDQYRIPYMPNHIVSGTADLRWKTGSVMVTAHCETTRYADTMNGMVPDPYITLHATVNQNIGKHFTAFASLRNILDAHYESFAGYYMPGISLVLGVQTKWDGLQRKK